MPWWGWLITAVVAFVGLYYVVVTVFAAKQFNRVAKHIDRVGKSDPFDDPFFKDPFGRGQTRKPHDRYL